MKDITISKASSELKDLFDEINSKNKTCNEDVLAAIVKARTSLAKQIPARLVFGQRVGGVDQYNCPVCNKGGYMSRCCNYCNNCGQAIAWPIE